MKKSDVFLKYYITVRWPPVCRNRSLEVMETRPDLVDQMNAFRVKIENVCKLLLKHRCQMDYNHNLLGVNLWLESGQDLYEFILRQPEFEWELLPEIGVVNRLTGEFKKFNLVYTPNGFYID